MRTNNQSQASQNAKKIKKNCIIYVLQLAKGRYYVGKSTKQRLAERIQQHKQGKGRGAAWTSLYKVQKQLKQLYEQQRSPFDQDRKVKQLMYIYGIDMVRGGSYSQTIQLNLQQYNFILKQFKGAMNQCYRCGQKGHFIKQCPQILKQKEKKKLQDQLIQQIKRQQQYQQNPNQDSNQILQKLAKQKKLTKKEYLQKKYFALPKCKVCKNFGHYQCDFNNYGEQYKKQYLKRIRCQICNKFGHVQLQCPQGQSSFGGSSCYFQSDSQMFNSDSDSDSGPVYHYQVRQQTRRQTNNYRSNNNNYQNRSRQKPTARNQCNYCRKFGHWQNSCFMKQRDMGRSSNYRSYNNNYYRRRQQSGSQEQDSHHYQSDDSDDNSF